MATFDDVFGQLKMPEKTIPFCLRSDLQAEWEELDRKTREAERDARDSLAGSGAKSRELAAQVKHLEEEMEKATHPLRLRALSRKAWSDLVAAHPPREGTDFGDFNADTFGVALLGACCVDPPMDAEQATRAVDSMTQGQWEKIQNVLWELNKGAVEVPNSRSASEILRTSRKR